MEEGEEQTINQQQPREKQQQQLCLEDLLEQQLADHRLSRTDVESALLEAPWDHDLQQVLIHSFISPLSVCQGVMTLSRVTVLGVVILQLKGELEDLIQEAGIALMELKKTRLLESVEQLQVCRSSDWKVAEFDEFWTCCCDSTPMCAGWIWWPGLRYEHVNVSVQD